ncbi:hypothetical protein IE4872_PD01701 (plasmid) [Rhizobium gallicum]|uniref:Alpha/beta hydrolase family protein n=2 Tax=Rhizobium gallicum TaxID=56730 RepID=A0A1L5NWE0_9HYPH|nr:hypothetical protein IE4872_PD01701 [Rhizobium gallicum]
MSELSALNFVNVGPNGTFRASGRLRTNPADIDAIFQHLSQTESKKLVIHFHGGLVPEATGAATALKMAKVYSDAGAHPVTFIWETGLIETISRNINDIGDTKLFQTLLKFLLRQLSKRLGVDLGGRGSVGKVSDKEVQQQLSKDDPFSDREGKIRAAAEAMDEGELKHIEKDMELDLQVDLDADGDFDDISSLPEEEKNRLKPEFRRTVDTRNGKGISIAAVAAILAKAGVRVIRRFMKGRDHGLYTTVVEEILRELYLADFGAWTWSGMKTVSSAMWLPNNAPINEDSYPGSYFIEKLATYQQANPDLIIDLVGHSAGSIAICNLFGAMQRRKIQIEVRNVVFLAPACQSRLMHAEIISQPQRFKAFRVFTMTDAFEQKDQLVRGVYPRSLLYFISGVLEEEPDMPIAGMQRFWTGKAPYVDPYLLDSTAWLGEEGMRRTVLSVIAEGNPGYLSAAEHHGDFDDDVLTQASLRAIVSA